MQASSCVCGQYVIIPVLVTNYLKAYKKKQSVLRAYALWSISIDRRELAGLRACITDRSIVPVDQLLRLRAVCSTELDQPAGIIMLGRRYWRLQENADPFQERVFRVGLDDVVGHPLRQGTINVFLRACMHPRAS